MRLLLTGCFNYSELQKNELQSLGYEIHFIQQESNELPIQASSIDAVVCNGLFLSHEVDEFTNLKLIQLTSAGFDRVPIDKIKDREIALYNARGVYSIPMAEWALYRVLEHYKQGWFFKEEQNASKWTKHRGLLEISQRKVAIVGAGNVGQEVAKRFNAFGAEVTGFDIHTNKTQYFSNMCLAETLKYCVSDFDIIILTAPLLPSTKGIISREVMMRMKKNAVLVNIARGGLIDEEAMCKVLTLRKDLFAALDVFEEEPLATTSPLWSMENTAISPHNSFVSDGNNTRMFDIIYKNLKSFINSQL